MVASVFPILSGSSRLSNAYSYFISHQFFRLFWFLPALTDYRILPVIPYFADSFRVSRFFQFFQISRILSDYFLFSYSCKFYGLYAAFIALIPGALTLSQRDPQYFLQPRIIGLQIKIAQQRLEACGIFIIGNVCVFGNSA